MKTFANGHVVWNVIGVFKAVLEIAWNSVLIPSKNPCQWLLKKLVLFMPMTFNNSANPSSSFNDRWSTFFISLHMGVPIRTLESPVLNNHKTSDHYSARRRRKKKERHRKFMLHPTNFNSSELGLGFLRKKPGKTNRENNYWPINCFRTSGRSSRLSSTRADLTQRKKPSKTINRNRLKSSRKWTSRWSMEDDGSQRFAHNSVQVIRLLCPTYNGAGKYLNTFGNFLWIYYVCYANNFEFLLVIT